MHALPDFYLFCYSVLHDCILYLDHFANWLELTITCVHGHCKNICVIATIFRLSQLHVYGVHIMNVQGMLPNKSSEDLENQNIEKLLL